MNFDKFGALGNPVSYFWSVTAPVVAFVIVVFCWDYFARLGKRVKRAAVHSSFKVGGSNLCMGWLCAWLGLMWSCRALR